MVGEQNNREIGPISTSGEAGVSKRNLNGVGRSLEVRVEQWLDDVQCSKQARSIQLRQIDRYDTGSCAPRP